ncbi:VOC family protein [Sphingomonas oligophenolica]|uniref:VOC family protein n=1 Tax=Sphingomonas oligophenolica TaxID=301154 RepID=A0ABU9Y759_9SPHN
MPKSVLPFLMFQGEGSAALDFYRSVFPDAKVEPVGKHDEPGAPPGLLPLTRLTIAGQTILLNDSPVRHAFTFTPSMSLFVECRSEQELRALSDALKQGGSELMPVGSYGFSTLFSWVTDRFGVSWQINVA